MRIPPNRSLDFRLPADVFIYEVTNGGPVSVVFTGGHQSEHDGPAFALIFLRDCQSER